MNCSGAEARRARAKWRATIDRRSPHLAAPRHAKPGVVMALQLPFRTIKRMSAHWVARPDAVEKVTQLSPMHCRGQVLFGWPRLRARREWGRGEADQCIGFAQTSNRRTWLALIALTLQMAVSFGHMHRDDLGLPPVIKAGQALALTDATGAPAGPADEDHHPASDHYCPICASIALIGTGAPALAPVLIVPLSIIHFSPPEKPADRPRPQLPSHFRRAGPQSFSFIFGSAGRGLEEPAAHHPPVPSFV